MRDHLSAMFRRIGVAIFNTAFSKFEPLMMKEWSSHSDSPAGWINKAISQDWDHFEENFEWGDIVFEGMGKASITNCGVVLLWIPDANYVKTWSHMRKIVKFSDSGSELYERFKSFGREFILKLFRLKVMDRIKDFFMKNSNPEVWLLNYTFLLKH